MRVHKLGIASESVKNQAVAGSDNEYQFPLLLSPEMIQKETETLDSAIENASGITKADIEKIKEAVDAFHDAALKSYRYCLNYRTGILDQNGQPTGQSIETLNDPNTPMINNRPIRVGRAAWLNSYDNGEVQRLGSFDCKKRIFFDQIERDFQAGRVQENSSSSQNASEEVTNPFGDQ